MKYVNLLFIFMVLYSCKDSEKKEAADIIAAGQMPGLAGDRAGLLHLTYGTGDSIMYAWSSDKGQNFSVPSLIGVLPKLAASHTRGPQLAVTSTGLVLTACNDSGNIFSFVKEGSGNWQSSARVNDMDTVAKENLMALSADGKQAFAVWLDLRDRHNKIFGARSADGGKTWSKNILVYASPDSTVCECCKPSVVVQGDQVYVMFRNWMNGNRDLYLIQSSDGGAHFKTAQKLGQESWALNGCPMDGGGLAINKNGIPQTVWNRKGKIYSDEPGMPEKEIGSGKGCAIESVNDRNIYAWVENGEVVVLKPDGNKVTLGKGQLPVVKAIDKEHVICVWENNRHVQKALMTL